MSTDPYQEFADRYDLFFKRFDYFYPHYVAFFRSLFTRYRVRTVLDCACGTGRHLYLFTQLGVDVVGSDISEAMMNQARKNLARFDLEVPMSRADFRELPRHFRPRFDAVVCLSTSLPHLPALEEAGRAVAGMYKVLKKGGILILSQAITDKMAANKIRFLPVVQQRDFSRIFAIDYIDQKNNPIAEVHVLDLFHSRAKSEFKVSVFKYLIILQENYRRFLTSAGFSESRFYGGYRFEPYSKKTSERLIIVARKK